MDRLEAMAVILAVNETGSISAASRRLGVPVATVSRKVSDLETRLKAQLFHRTSKRMTLTDAGRSYVDACRRIIEQVDDAEREVTGEYRSPKGDLVVTAPWGLGHTHLLPLAIEFLKAYPDISLRLLLTDRVVNMTEEGVNIGIRVGPLPDSNLLAARIGSIRIVVCGSPDYFAIQGKPVQLGDLQLHDCITIDDHSTPSSWKFARGKSSKVIAIKSRLCVNTSEAAVSAAMDGCGLARVMSYKMDAARRDGKLAIVLEEFEPESLPVHIIYAPRKPMPLKIRAFLNWMTPRLKVRLALN